MYKRLAMSPLLATTALFSLEGIAFAEIFHGSLYPWEALSKLSKYLESKTLGNIEIAVPASVHLAQPELISIGKGTVIEPGVFIKGPCIIGENCEIRHGAYLRGPLLIGHRCVVGHATEVKHSILLNDACLGHLNYVGDSVVGQRVNIGAGVKCANLRFDHREVQIALKDQKVATGLKKLGAILGDDAQVGCNAVTNPGTVVCKAAFCRPCVAISGYVSSVYKMKSSKGAVKDEYADSTRK